MFVRFFGGLDGDINQRITRALRCFGFTLGEVDGGVAVHFNNYSESLWIGQFLLSSNLPFLSWAGFSVT